MILNSPKTEYINMHSTAFLLQAHLALFVLGTTNSRKTSLFKQDRHAFSYQTLCSKPPFLFNFEDQYFSFYV